MTANNNNVSSHEGTIRVPARVRTHVGKITRAEPASDINNAGGRWGCNASQGSQNEDINNDI